MKTPAHEIVSAGLQGYSPRIVTTLHIGDEQLNVRVTCDEYICVESDRTFPASDARMETLIGDELDITHIRLLDGIDPSRDEQPIRVLSES